VHIPQPDATRGESENFSGISASRITLIIFTSIVCITYFICYKFNFKSAYLAKIAANNFLVISHSYLIIAIIEFFTSTILPKFIKKIVTKLLEWEEKIYFINIRPFSIQNYVEKLINKFAEFIKAKLKA